MKKILFALLILFLLEDFAFGQITCVDSKTIFSKLGLEMSYCTVSLGKDGVCGKYRVTIYENNSSNQTISIEGGQLYIDPHIGMFPAAGTCGKREEYAGSDGIIWIEFPWVNANGLRTEIPPNSSFQKSFIVYTKGEYPEVGVRGIYTRYLNDKSSSNNKGSSDNILPAQWSGWETTDCYKQLEFRFKTVELYNLNYQVHMYFEVRSKYSDAVSFTFNLTDKNNNIQFRDQRSINGGSTIEFIHKMDSKKITSISIENVKNSSGKVINCNDNSGTNSQTANNPNGNNQNSNSQSPSYVGSGAANVQAKLDAIQVHLDKIPKDDLESQAIVRDATSIINNTGTSEQAKVNQLDPLLTRARNRANQLVTNKEKEEKITSERDNNFKSYYEKGMANYSSKNYDGAINNLQTSLNYAVNDQQKKHVQDWIAKIREEKRLEAEAAARKARVDDKLKQEQQVNTEAAAATTVAVALFSILKDRYDERPANLRFQVGLGLESIPIIVNDDFNKKSSFETTLHYSIMAGLKLGLFNQNGVSFHLNPVYYLGFNAGSQGTDGRHGTYGGIATLQMGLKAESVFKLYAEGGWLKRSGNYNYDQDAASGGTTASDLVEKGTYNYGLARFGGGIMLHFVNEPRETYIKGGIYFEKLSFASKSPQMVGSLQINISSTIILDFLYSKNYAIAGKADYPTTILPPLRSILPEEYNKSYFSVRLIRQGIF